MGVTDHVVLSNKKIEILLLFKQQTSHKRNFVGNFCNYQKLVVQLFSGSQKLIMQLLAMVDSLFWSLLLQAQKIALQLFANI